MGRFYRGSLALRVLAVSIIFVSLPLLVYFLFVYQEGYEARMQEVVVRLHDLGYDRSLVLRQLNAFDLRVIDMIEQLAANRTTPPPPRGEPDPWLSDVLTSISKGGGFAAAYYISVEPGKPFIATAASNKELIGRDFSADRYVQDVMINGQVSFLSLGSIVTLAAGSFEKYFFFAKLIYDKETHKPIGILNLSTPVDDLIKRLVEMGEAPYNINVSLVTRNNIIIASSDPDLTLRVLPSEGRELSSGSDQVQVEPVTDISVKPIKGVRRAFELNWRGKKSIAVEVPVQGMELTLLLTANEAEAFGDLHSRLIEVLAVFVVIFLLGGGVALWITHRMSLPLYDLVEVMNRVSRGDLTARVQPSQMGFEINIIGEIFNSTINSLRDQMARAEAERVQKETLDQEFKIGREIQMAILPTARPKFPGVEIAARYLPAKQVGGDFYDVFVKPHQGGDTQDLVLTVADASGKGISACLYSLLLRSMLRSYAVSYENIAEIMERANNLFCEDTGMTGMFVTALTAIYHPEDKSLTYFSGGHTPGFIRRSSGKIEVLQNRGTALGVIPFKELQSDKVHLSSGDLLILYTDGVTEAHNEDNELFGETRLVEYIRDQGGKGVDMVVDGLINEIAHFRGSAPQFDDITIMVMQIS